MTGTESAGNAWLREERRRRRDPDERNATRESLMLRLFGDPDSEEPTDGQPDPDPAA